MSTMERNPVSTFVSGCVFSCNKKAKTQSEKITAIYNAHFGPVYALQVKSALKVKSRMRFNTSLTHKLQQTLNVCVVFML